MLVVHSHAFFFFFYNLCNAKNLHSAIAHLSIKGWNGFTTDSNYFCGNIYCLKFSKMCKPVCQFILQILLAYSSAKWWRHTVVTGSRYCCYAPVLSWFCVVIGSIVVQDRYKHEPVDLTKMTYHFSANGCFCILIRKPKLVCDFTL